MIGAEDYMNAALDAHIFEAGLSRLDSLVRGMNHSRPRGLVDHTAVARALDAAYPARRERRSRPLSTLAERLKVKEDGARVGSYVLTDAIVTVRAVVMTRGSVDWSAPAVRQAKAVLAQHLRGDKSMDGLRRVAGLCGISAADMFGVFSARPMGARRPRHSR